VRPVCTVHVLQVPYSPERSAPSSLTFCCLIMSHQTGIEEELVPKMKTCTVTEGGKKLDDTFFIEDVYFEVRFGIPGARSSTS
jgi:hypothetical protein